MENKEVLKKRSIVCIVHPDKTLMAQEVFIDKTAAVEFGADEVNVKAIPGTERILPLTKEDAENWVNKVMIESPEEERTAMVKMLCGEDLGWTT